MIEEAKSELASESTGPNKITHQFTTTLELTESKVPSWSQGEAEKEHQSDMFHLLVTY